MFSIFNIMCRKYGFRYSLSNSGELHIMLHPDNTFENIKVTLGYRSSNFIKLFLMAIKTMKEYRKKGYQ